MGMYKLYSFIFEQAPHLSPFCDIKRSLRMDHMRPYPHLTERSDHGPVGKRKDHRFEPAFIQVIYQAQQMRLSSSHVPLPDAFKYLYLLTHDLYSFSIQRSYHSWNISTCQSF